jgi:hypothetical protein
MNLHLGCPNLAVNLVRLFMGATVKAFVALFQSSHRGYYPGSTLWEGSGADLVLFSPVRQISNYGEYPEKPCWFFRCTSLAGISFSVFYSKKILPFYEQMSSK